MAAKRFSVVRDPVHGDVYLTHEELALLDTPEMQRLRGIKQLGTAFLTYPGAVHTRFDHSIGVLHLTQKVIEAINLNFELDPKGSLSVGDEEARILRMAALIHDVTHIPYGHNIEDQTGLFHRHDSDYRFRRMLSADTELGALLAKQGVAADVLSTLLARQGDDGGQAIPAYWSQLVSDSICPDILDYLQRDAYFTGLRLGVDPRIASYFKIDRASGNVFIDLAKRDLLREDILSEILRMLEARYYFSERVYYHHAKVSAGALLARAVELAVVNELLVEEDFYDQTDASLLELLRRRSFDAPASSGSVGPTIRDLVSRFAKRRLLKRACVFPRYANAEVQDELVARAFSPGSHAARAALEARIATEVRHLTGSDIQVILYCPAATMQLKEVHTHVRWPGEKQVRPLSDFSDRVQRLTDLERSYRNLWKFYVFADTDDPRRLRKIQDVVSAEIPEAKNVYRIEDAI